jgi:serine phosphatase RsbU (regulator of sigma subunit)
MPDSPTRPLSAEESARAAAEAANATIKSLNQAVARISRLQGVTAALSETVSVAQIVAVILDQISGAFQPSAGAIVLLDETGRHLEVEGHFGYPDGLIDKWKSFSIDSPVPLADVVRSGRTIPIPSLAALKERYPAFANGASSNKAFISLQLAVRERVIGALGFSFENERDFTAGDITLLESLAQQCAQALERVRLYNNERAARRAAEEAQQRLAFLAEASRVLGSSLDYSYTLAKVARLAVPRLADWCSIDIVEDDGSTRQLVIEHVDPSKVELSAELRRRFPADPESEYGVPHVVATGRSQLYHEVSDELLEAASHDSEHLAMLKKLGFTSAMIVPLRARGRALGALTLVSDDRERLFDEEDLAFAEDLAGRAGLAVDNARLFQERSYVARTLQRSLLPPRMAEVPGIEIAARYRPAAEGHEVGGDFYDVFQDKWGAWVFVIGDIQGKGAAAAAVTGLARHTLRATAMHKKEPAEILGVLNEVLLQDASDRFCTAAYLRLDRDGGHLCLTAASGGHPPPCVVRADGSVASLVEPGMLVGAFEEYEATDLVTELHPGDLVVLYTDGVSEERDRGGGLSEKALAELLASCAGLSPEEAAERIEQAVVAAQMNLPKDDIAIVVLKVGPQEEQHN